MRKVKADLESVEGGPLSRARMTRLTRWGALVHSARELQARAEAMRQALHDHAAADDWNPEALRKAEEDVQQAEGLLVAVLARIERARPHPKSPAPHSPVSKD